MGRSVHSCFPFKAKAGRQNREGDIQGYFKCSPCFRIKAARALLSCVLLGSLGIGCYLSVPGLLTEALLSLR